MSLLKKICGLLDIYNTDSFDYLKVLKKNRVRVRFEKDEESLIDALPEDSGSLLIVTDSLFSGLYLEKLGFYSNAKIWKIEEESMEEAEKIIRSAGGCLKVMGFGGGRPLDVAKMVAFKLGKPLVSVPTAPSHDGLISRNCALKVCGVKRSFSTLYPVCIIVPEHLWHGAENHRMSGILDVLSNIVALQDVSLSMKKTDFIPDVEHMVYALLAVRRLLNEQDMDSFAKALIMSGLAMHKQSNYCSGSEHEVEKIVSAEGFNYMHGQLAGTGILVAAKVYEMYADRIPQGLFFDSRTLYTEIVRLFAEQGVLRFALEPVIDKKDVFEKLFRNLHKVRPERYNLWNFISPEEIDWKVVMDEIVGTGFEAAALSRK